MFLLLFCWAPSCLDSRAIDGSFCGVIFGKSLLRGPCLVFLPNKADFCAWRLPQLSKIYFCYKKVIYGFYYKTIYLSIWFLDLIYSLSILKLSPVFNIESLSSYSWLMIYSLRSYGVLPASLAICMVWWGFDPLGLLSIVTVGDILRDLRSLFLRCILWKFDLF